MGGWNSGRRDGRPTADSCKRIDIAYLIRRRCIIPSHWMSGTLHWSRGSMPAGSISYDADMRDPDNAVLRLSYVRGEGDDKESVKQTVRLVFTEPNYGGRRWWMICPAANNRVAKLYLPPWGDRFAGRKAWRLGYKIQRVAHHDRAFEALFRLQRKLGSYEGWQAGICRPKGMWKRTFDRHFERYLELEERCDAEAMALFGVRGWSLK